MPFTVGDFEDLLRLLDQHPEWRQELRRRVLAEELLDVPAALRQLAEAQARTEGSLASLAQRVDALGQRLDTLTQQVEALAAAQVAAEQHLATLTQRVDDLTARLDTLTQRVDDLTARLDTLTQRVDDLTARLEALTQRVDDLTQRVDTLTQRVDDLARSVARLTDRVGEMDGQLLELSYWRRAPAYFSHLARRLRVIDFAALADQLDDAVEAKRVSEAERDEALAVDLVLTGRRRTDGAEAYFAVEISGGIGIDDVRRAAERARILEKLGRPAVPVVAGRWISHDAEALARDYGVSCVLDGRAIAMGADGR